MRKQVFIHHDDLRVQDQGAVDDFIKKFHLEISLRGFHDRELTGEAEENHPFLPGPGILPLQPLGGHLQVPREEIDLGIFQPLDLSGVTQGPGQHRRTGLGRQAGQENDLGQLSLGNQFFPVLR